jgi:diguanylate cyclase (GGDEF)-like protein
MAKEMAIDQVTGVGTRRWLERCMEELADAPGSGSVMMLDLDRFKDINDTFGHSAGDRVLARVGSVLNECLRRSDLIARYGGEEFVVFLPNASIDESHQLAERITVQLRLLDWSDIAPNMSVTISTGVAAGSFADPRELLEAADQALYRAKRAGRDRVVLAETV